MRHFQLPADAAIKVLGRCVCVDRSATQRAHLPCWYYLNHASRANANTRMQMWVVGRSIWIVWVTAQAVQEGEELTFEYGNADPEWLP